MIAHKRNHPPKDALKTLVMADLCIGHSIDEAQELLKKLEKEEHYEACAGVVEAIELHKKNECACTKK